LHPKYPEGKRNAGLSCGIYFGNVPAIEIKSGFSYFTKEDSHFVTPSAFI
jgi:hypothetical protein